MTPLEKHLHEFVTEPQWGQLMAYVDVLKAWNQKINLVSRQDVDALLEHHIAPSLAFAVLNRIAPEERVLDIGSGGGLPGIVNAILFPETTFVLVDARQKKITAVQNIVETLGLQNVSTVWARVEDLATDRTHAVTYHRTTSRAVAPLTDLVAWSRPLLRARGSVEALKGGDVTADVEALMTRSGLQPNAVTIHSLPVDWQQYSQRLADLVLVTVVPD